MSMQVGEAGGEEDTPMSDINTTPLVDVMLVLLIIFLITVPVVLQTMPVELPKVVYEPTETKPENVNLSVTPENGECEVYWGVARVNSEQLYNRAVRELEDLLERVGGVENVTEENMPEAHIRGDINTPYRCIGGAIFAMQRAGFLRIGFISEPPPQARSPSPDNAGHRSDKMSATVLNPESAEPMMEINTTPLIDVMLVLLIMFIITIPIQSHAVKLDLPQQTDAPPPPIEPVKNKIFIQPNGAVLWNGTPVESDAAAPVSGLTTQMRPGARASPRAAPGCRATRSSTRCSRSPSAPTSPRWASSATSATRRSTDARAHR